MPEFTPQQIDEYRLEKAIESERRADRDIGWARLEELARRITRNYWRNRRQRTRRSLIRPIPPISPIA